MYAVSVLMSVFDGARYLPATLDTLLIQSLRNFQLVIVDDGSTDETPAILADYASRDSRIRIVSNKRNLGLAASLNRGLNSCSAPVVARADADDLYEPGYLEAQVRYLADHKEVGVVSSAFQVADEDGKPLYTKYLPQDDPHIRLQGLFMCPLFHPTMVFRSEVVRAVGGYDEHYWTAQDYELWSRLRERTRFANQQIPLVRYRRHSGATINMRGRAGSVLSHGITQQLLSDYLGATVTLDQAGWLRTLYYGLGELSSSEIRAVLPVLDRTLERARRQENPIVVRTFRKRMAAHFMERSYNFVEADSDPATARLLFRAALRWNPAMVWRNPATLKFGSRLAAPQSVARIVRSLWQRSRSR